jgi:hypothetical protein
MHRPLIHIGYHKTGTSWLQRYLFGRQDRGFAPLAPDTDMTPKAAAKFLSRYFIYDEAGRLLSPFRSRVAEVHDVLSSMQLPDRAKPVISHERLSGNPHSGGFDAKVIGERLAEAFPDAGVLIIIREQVSMIISTYFQYLKIGESMGIGTYLAQKYDGRRPGFTPTQFQYHHLVSHYQALFGRESVLVLPYEWFRSDARRFIGLLSAFSGVDIDPDLEYQEVPNLGLPRAVEYGTRFLNPFIRESSVNSHSSWVLPGAEKSVRGLRRLAAGALPAGAERRFVEKLHREIRQIVGNQYHESNKLTTELIDIDLGALGYD